MIKEIMTDKKYFDDAKGYKNLYLLGRLAEYKYINMDVAVKNAMDLFEEITGDSVSEE